MFIYGLLMPLTALMGSAMSYYSLQSSLSHDWNPVIILIIVNIAVSAIIWPLISLYSSNLVFDELLFVVILAISELASISILDKAMIFSWFNWLGLAIAFIGFILMKLTWEEKIEKQVQGADRWLNAKKW